MIQVSITCNYCNNKWPDWFLSKEDIDAATCKQCGDTSLTVRPLHENSDVFGYSYSDDKKE